MCFLGYLWQLTRRGQFRDSVTMGLYLWKVIFLKLRQLTQCNNFSEMLQRMPQLGKLFAGQDPSGCFASGPHEPVM